MQFTVFLVKFYSTTRFSFFDTEQVYVIADLCISFMVKTAGFGDQIHVKLQFHCRISLLKALMFISVKVKVHVVKSED